MPVDPARKASDVAVFGDRSIEVPRRHLDEADLRGLIAQQIAEREAAAQAMEALGRNDRAEILRAEAAIVARYL